MQDDGNIPSIVCIQAINEYWRWAKFVRGTLSPANAQDLNTKKRKRRQPLSQTEAVEDPGVPVENEKP